MATEQHTFKHALGLKVRDLVTGFEGTIVGRSQWLTGCDTYIVKPKAVDNKDQESQHFDEARLELLDEPQVKIPATSDGKPGGPGYDRDQPKA